jgi:hypothetical protein
VLTLGSVAVAVADTAYPNNDTSGTFVVNADGTVTATLHGTWSWTKQTCENRYGTAWAVDWWGVSTSKTPANNFTLTNAPIVTSPTTTTTGSGTATGYIAVPPGSPPPPPGTPTYYFHVSTYYAGQAIHSATTCTDLPGGGSTGSWSATATYPNQSDLPPQVCVNMYDVHGKEGTPSTNPIDYNPSAQGDNSIQQKLIDPTAGEGCVTPNPTPIPIGTIGAVFAAVLFAGGLGFVQWRSSRRRRAPAA